MADDTTTTRRVDKRTAFCLLLGVLLLPLWIMPVIAIGLVALIAYAIRYERWRDRIEIAETSGCPECGALLGRRAITASDESVKAAKRDSAAANLWMKRRRPRRHDAICVVCDTELRFDSKSQMFVRLLSAVEKKRALSDQERRLQIDDDARRPILREVVA